jgi:hypothetical protein
MRRRGGRGQAIVEFALTMPIFLFLVLGGGELAFFVAQQFSLQRGADILADAAAERITPFDPANPKPDDESWRGDWFAIARDENIQRNCGDSSPEVLFPDGGRQVGDRVRIVWHCFYHPRITTMWDGLSLTVTGEAVIRR